MLATKGQAHQHIAMSAAAEILASLQRVQHLPLCVGPIHGAVRACLPAGMHSRKEIGVTFTLAAA
jgi:hypothetical protein